LSYIERSSIGIEERSILVGVAFAGPYICVNTRQLKLLIGRCKSSINGNFQQLGYTSLRTKSGELLSTILPSLVNEMTVLRQWTVRCASEDAQFCFASRSRFPNTLRDVHPHIPEKAAQPPPDPTTVRSMPVPILGPKAVNFDLSAFRELELPAVPETGLRLGEFWDDPSPGKEETLQNCDRPGFSEIIPRSQSAIPPMPEDWFL
jgi:hypothetical protein